MYVQCIIVIETITNGCLKRVPTADAGRREGDLMNDLVLRNA
jgi:hypothetical protein